MLEINIPQKTIKVLFDAVLERLNGRELGTFPFYTRVTQQMLLDGCPEILDIGKVEAGYIYAHDETIPLHVDRYKKDAAFNLNIPLYSEDENQYFMVFDQEFTERGCEWQAEGSHQKRHEPLTAEDKSSSNSDNNHLESWSLRERPWESKADITGLTDVPVNEDIVPYLPFNKDFYFGLSGKVWKQTVGKGLLFKSSQLHGTAKQNKFKVGCVLMLKDDLCLKTL
jgi:hypothetical protein